MYLPSNGYLAWEPHPKQSFALARPETEILFGGSRGGGKSDASRAWPLRWIDNPNFRGLVIRIQAEDLKDWCERANQLWSQFGAEMVGRPPLFRFPSGAIIYTGHLQDANAYTKYQGWGVQKMIVEELTLIPREDDYVKLLGSLRSPFPELSRQVFSTTNPGGPGSEWVRSRFINAVDYANRPAVEMKSILMDKGGKQSRIYVPATIDDNPSLADADPGYIEYLDSLPENLRRAWRYGDWDAFKGQYFSEYRNFPKPGEPAEARHVIPAMPIPRWCPRWIGWDWAYTHDSAVYWAAQTEDSRVHVYREIVANGKSVSRRFGAEEMGALVAEASLEDLEGLPDKHLTVYLSPDAYQKRDARNTIAQQIEVGMRMVLGRDAVFLVDLNDDEKMMPAAEAYQSLQRRRDTQRGQVQITIERANNDRKAGWMYLRKLLRWWPMRVSKGDVPDENVVRAILRMSGGPQKFTEYMRQFSSIGETLPLLQIHDACPELPKGILAARHSDKDPEDVQKEDGDDRIDALRYLLMGHRKMEISLPREEFVQRSLAAKTSDSGFLSTQGRVMLAMYAESQYEKEKRAGSGMVLARRTRIADI